MSERPADGNCADLPPQVFDKYFLGTAKDRYITARVAKAICANCVVRVECLGTALMATERPGIWAGKSRDHLAAIRQRMVREEGYVHPQFLTEAEVSMPEPREVWSETPPHVRREAS